jgi:hypothetical protein
MSLSRRDFGSRVGIVTAGIVTASIGGLGRASAASAQTGPATAYQTSQAILDAIPTMTFTHEGALNTSAELRFVRRRIQHKLEPWFSSYEKLATSSYASFDYTPHPVPHVSQDFSGARDVGGFDLINDSIAAHSHALMWQLTHDSRHAQKAVDILNAWSATLVDIRGGNWVLLAAWSGSVSPLAAEIVRNYPGWASADKARYRNMLNTAYLPILNQRYGYGNREFAYCDALCAIGVFNEDRAAFYQGVHHWLSYLPCYVYLAEDGPAPKVADYWVTEPTLDEYYAMHANIFPNPADSWVYQPNNPEPGVLGDDKTAMVKAYTTGDPTPLWYGMSATTGGWVPGACAETLRDLGHVENSIAAVFAVTELARVQGYDLYTESKTRLAAFLERQSSLRLGTPCPGGYSVVWANGVSPTYEVGYDRLANALGMDLPNTRNLIQPALRSAQSHYWTKPAPGGVAATALLYQATYSGGWETLTHGNLNGPNPTPWNLALGKPATASTLQDSDHLAGNATDGNPSTRWASTRSDPQWIYVDLGASYVIRDVTLNWEAAYAKAYSIQVSDDAVTWTTIYRKTKGTGGVEQLTGLSGSGRYVRMYGTRRATRYGYSLREFQIYGYVPVGTNLALYRPATASSVLNGQSVASNATDGNVATRWASVGGDPQWIYVDLGASHEISGVTLLPHSTNYAKSYSIQVCDDTATWTTIYSTTAGSFLSQVLTGLAGRGRYVRLYATQGATQYGCALWDLQVYGAAA